jgi:HEAT repeat protein
MWSSLRLLAAVLVLGGFVAACSPRQAAPARRELTREELVDAWKRLPAAGRDNLDVQTAKIIGMKLAENGVEGLRPIFDALGDPQGDPLAKVLAVITVTAVLIEKPELKPQLEGDLLRLTEAGQETSTRSCAAHLLGHYVETPAADARMRALLKDPEVRVRHAATLACIARQFPEAMAELDAFWKDPETTPEERTQFLLVLPDDARHTRFFKEGALDEKVDLASRLHAVSVLARSGDASVLDALGRLAETAQEPELRQSAGAAKAVIEKGLNTISAGAAPPAPEPGDPAAPGVGQ